MFKVENAKREDAKKLPKKRLKVLLMKRNKEPFKGCWLFPYGFVNIDESLDDAVYRKLKETTKMDNIFLEQLYTWGAVDRDPTARVIATSYMAIIPEDQLKSQEIKEREELKWFTVSKEFVSFEKTSDVEMTSKYLVSLINDEEKVTIAYYVKEKTFTSGFEKRNKYSYEHYLEHSEKMAYDHIKILDYALDRIKNKVFYTNIAFGLLPEYFTLTELQQVYELLLGKQLVKSNFRQLIGKKVEKTEQIKKDGAYRPSQLYRLKKESVLG